ncbi:MAG: cofactor-independent phosphoglycerate mutase [Phycisphaeraceae bacterium]
MKYAIIIPDGAADRPLDELDGRTPLEAADTPHLDALAEQGRQGTAATTPAGMPCGSDVCTMSLLGYDPQRYHRGRAPLEAAALGIELNEADWIFRVNLVTVIDGKMQDHSAGHISSSEGRKLLSDFAAHAELPDFVLYPGVSYRNIMVDVSSRGQTEDAAGDVAAQAARVVGGAAGVGRGRDWSELETTAPHDIPGEPIRKHLPVGGEHAAVLQQIVAESERYFAEHEINQTRREMGELPATHLWPWGQGRRPVMPAFAERFGVRGAMITAVDLLAGIASFIGWDRLDVPGQSSYHDNDYAATGRYAVEAIKAYDLVCVHVESPDEASHAADAATKVAAIEAIDTHVVGPVCEALARGHEEGWRVLVMPDHYTLVDTRKHDPTPVPFLMAGTRVHAVLHPPLSERNANGSDLHVAHGHELMEYFLFGGLH